MAHGLNQVYHKVHARYQSKIEQNGGFMTEFWSNSQPNRENFLKRNRIIAGISEATILIESAEKGGSLVTADLAHGYHREVFAVPGRATDKWSKVRNDLIKYQKAHLSTSAAELGYLLGWEIVEEKQKNRPETAVHRVGRNRTVNLLLFASEGKTTAGHRCFGV